MIVYLGIQEGSENGNSSTNGVDWPDLGVENDNGGDNHCHALHGVTNAEGEWGNLVQGHVRDLVVQVVEYTLRHYPPTRAPRIVFSELAYLFSEFAYLFSEFAYLFVFSEFA